MRKFLLVCLTAVFALASSEVWAQERTISGRITSPEDGSPMPGVNVVLKGSTNGTVTDVDGRYSLSVPQSGGTLVFSFIGLKSQEVVIGERTTVDLQMDQDVTQLSEVVVSALGIEQNRDELGTASSNIGGSAVSKSGEATLINGLAAKASGVNIIKSSGDPGAGAYIQIRGQSTITGNLQPLIILDGMPIYNSQSGISETDGNVDGVAQQSRLNDLNPDDIQSIEVLKGASAGALWGTRAANGVIVITTKKGSSDKGKINVSLKYTRSMDKLYIAHDLTKNWGSGTLMQYQNAPSSGGSWGDYIPDRKGGADAFITDPTAPGYNGFFQAADGTRFYAIPNGTAADPHGGKNSRDVFDYRDNLFKTGSYNDFGVTLNGGDKDGNFYISIDNLKQDGIIQRNSNYDRTSIRVNTNKRFNEFVKMSSNFGYTKTKSNRTQMGSNVSGLYLGGLRTSPDFNNEYAVGTYTDANGVVAFDRQRAYRNPLGASEKSTYDNPLWMMDHNISTSDVDRFMGSFELGVSPWKWFDITARAGVDTYIDRRYDLLDPLASAQPGGKLILQNLKETQFNGDLFGRGKFNLNEDLTLIALVGLNLNQRQYERIGGTAQSFIIDKSIPTDITNATLSNQFPFNAFTQQRTAAVYSTLDFAYKNMLFLGLTGRGESASTFGRATKSTFYYPAANLAWQFSQLLESDVLSFGKLRTSYGQVGVQPSPYNTATYYTPGGVLDGWGTQILSAAYNGGYTESTTLGNAFLKPERKTEIEFGTDLRFFQDRVSLSATYFTNKTTDAILKVATAASTGFADKVANAAEITNHGWEFDLGADILKVGDFSWKLSGNWSMYRNKVTSLAGTSSLFLNGFAGTSSRAVEGQPLGVLWGIDWEKDAQGNLMLDERGFPKAATNESVIGNPNPDWKAAFGNTFSFKGFSLYVLVERTQGGQIWAGTHGIMNNFGRSTDTDVLSTISAAEAAAMPVWGSIPNNAGGTDRSKFVAERYTPNADGTYTFRGSVQDFGGGKVALDQGWYTDLGGGFGPVASQFVKDATNTRIREVTLAYSLNSSAFRAATKLTSIDFSITGRNLFITGPDIKYIGTDPETNLTGSTNGRGLEYFNNPATRSYLFTIKINY
ncbi:SusC/RagA family TonB-linked outer membrane protein [Chryseolinea lacunae]|uniref:SusC/RagA family TonB-linked outer membrane protein n=1 Tax=Chryseolinea lacunae TaxID=2801331 RepID=A0ABS1L0H1_9BACT|nr:SusC/RagA family TonB-linked outer membrane protein [Chryseolinea lacunae]MBL0745203.1 SusC/RagA family TonB-linked outer membrane protein [Chryseolinea lacunae]